MSELCTCYRNRFLHNNMTVVGDSSRISLSILSWYYVRNFTITCISKFIHPVVYTPCSSSKARLSVQHIPTGGLQKNSLEVALRGTRHQHCALYSRLRHSCRRTRDGKWTRGRKLMSGGRRRRRSCCLLPQRTSFRRQTKQIRVSRFHSKVFVFCLAEFIARPIAQLQATSCNTTGSHNPKDQKENFAQIIYYCLKKQLWRANLKEHIAKSCRC